MLTGAYRPGTHEIPRLRQPKPPYRSWASFDPYADNVGCTIRVARRPSSLVKPPKVRSLEQRQQSPKAGKKAPPPQAASSGSPEPVPRSPPPPPTDEASTVMLQADAATAIAALAPPPALSKTPSSSPPRAAPQPHAPSTPGVQKRDKGGGARSFDISIPPAASSESFFGVDPPVAWLGSSGSRVPLLPPSPMRSLEGAAADGVLDGTAGGGAAIDDRAGLSPEGHGPVPMLFGSGRSALGDDGNEWAAEGSMGTATGATHTAGAPQLSAAAASARAAAAAAAAFMTTPAPPAPPPATGIYGELSAGSRARAAAAAPSLMQLEELDSLLTEHQMLLRDRVERLREEKRMQHEEWFSGIQQILPTPTKPDLASAGGARAHVLAAASRGDGGVAPPSPPHALSTSMPPLGDAASPPRPSAGARSHAAEPHPHAAAAAAAAASASAANCSNRSSLESLAELEALLEEQHNQLIARGFIPPTEEAPWRVQGKPRGDAVDLA